MVAVGLTYTRARDVERQRTRFASVTLGEQLLLATSAVIALAILLGYAGRLRSEAWGKSDSPAPVNLNEVTRAEELEPALSAVFPYPAERRAAAQALAAYLETHDVQNVGALSRVTTAPSGADAPPPRLLTSADVAVLKPLLSVRTRGEFRNAVLWCTLGLLLSFHAVSFVWRWRGVPGDRVLLALAHLLVGLGFVMMLTRPDPLRDTLLIVRYTQGVVIGVALFGAASLINLNRSAFRELTYLPLAGALVLSVVLLVFGSGPGSSGAKVNLGPVQPIEAIRLLLALFLAGFFARRWELLRQVRTETIRQRPLPAWLNLPRLDHALPVIAGVAAALTLFFFQKDLGPALLLSLMFLALFAIARGGAWLAGAGFAGLVAGFAVGYLVNLSSTLVGRIQMWSSPWDNPVRGGDQIAQGLWGLAAGSVSGTGAGLGSTRFIPEGHTDLVLAAIGEELGFLGLLVAVSAFGFIAWRGFQIARRASSDYRFFLALALTLSLTIPVLVMGAGILGLLPLTGVVTPFLSYGGSAMVANFVALGLLVAIDRDRDWRATADLAPFRVPVRWLARAAAASAAAMIVVAAGVQVLRADGYLVRPQLSVQADGGRRFQYNPRVLDALRSIPRGTIYDARGLPLATSDPAVLRKATPDYQKLGRPVADSCPNPLERCYPAGPAFFHVLGDANTRANWSAANSSYIERDADDLLRGFSDDARTVKTTDREGRETVAVRRDYASVVPLVRHRWTPDHPEVREVLERTRDVRLTIDARLQLAVASILARAAKAGGGKGAVVVLDAESGRVLASVSYPWPGMPVEPLPVSEAAPLDAEGFFDRARYGLYPPGSTFKIVTAAAALREGPAFSQREFVCQRLPSNRFGIRIPGIGPIHDDERDERAHGQIGLHDAIVRSCNAYFAQMAMALGSEALARTASTAGIALNASRQPDRIQANLPHAGYGQGEVVATPLRLARVAAALGTDGVIREASLAQRPGAGPIETALVPALAARTLAVSLRHAVQNGTGRLLRDHPARIAGKTGTAEIDEAGSHAWFVGFAPHGQATRRIAFAVVLEHAGYGGVAAATVAGQVATAAASLGFVK
jgi:cell division protein FtsW (lipid II flippase)